MKKGFLFTTALAMALGVGVAVGAHQSQRVEKAEATTESVGGTKLKVVNQTGQDWVSSGKFAIARIWGISVSDDSDFASITEVKNLDLSLGGVTTYNGDGTIDIQLTEGTEDSKPCYEVTVPWFIDGFTVCFYSTNIEGGVWMKYRNNGDAYQFSTERGKSYRVYAYEDGTDYKSWIWEGTFGVNSFSKVEDDDFVYDEQKCDITVAADPVAGGQVSGAGSFLRYSKTSIVATANTASGYSFASWNDGSTDANHSVVVLEDKEYTASFVQLPALDAPVIAKDENNVVSWEAVTGAVKYIVNVDGVTTEVDNTVLSVQPSLYDGSHEVKVMAKGNNADHVSSVYSNTVSYSVVGYYIVGTRSSWAVQDGAVALQVASENVYTVSSVAMSANEEFKVIRYLSEGTEWYGPNDDSKLTINNIAALEEGYEVTRLDGGNIKIAKAGNYRVTYNKTTGMFEVYNLDVSEEFEVTIGSKTVSLVGVEKGEHKAQFKATVTGTASGEVISFKRGNTTFTAPVADGTEFNNVYIPDSKIIVAGDVDVYLKLENDNSWTYYVSGRSTTYYIYTGSRFTPLVANPENPAEVYATNVSMTKDDSVVIYTTSVINPVLNESSKDVVEVVENVVKVKTTGTYNVYYAFGSTSLYVGDASLADLAADEYIENFLNVLSRGENHVCQMSGDTDQEELFSTWGTLETAFQNIAEDAEVKADAQLILKNTSYVSGDDRAEFAKLYDTIIKKYGTSNCHDFALRFGGEYNPQVLAKVSNVESGSTTIVVIAVATVSALACGMLFIFKKKEQK